MAPWLSIGASYPRFLLHLKRDFLANLPYLSSRLHMLRARFWPSELTSRYAPFVFMLLPGEKIRIFCFSGQRADSASHAITSPITISIRLEARPETPPPWERL